jgi:zinc transport system ATP-binding protein
LNSKNAVVSLEHVSFGYSDVLVLQDVSCTIYEGEFVGIIGPNGGGKTTLLRLLMGFLKPQKGQIKLFGKIPTEELPEIAYVPQTVRFDKLFPISVLEVVMQGRLAHLPWYGFYSQKDKEIALEALDRVSMTGFQNNAFGTLSGGQAQRVLIARALASRPKLLLLDEPTASVDAQAQAEIYAILKSLAGTMTILMVTHDLNMAIEHVKKIICVQRTVLALTPQEVCEHFALGLYHTPLITGIQNHKKIPQ